MRCMSCGYDNPPGVDHCEQCHASFTQEDVPLAKIKSAMEHSLSEDKVATLNLVEAISVPEDDFPRSSDPDYVTTEYRLPVDYRSR